jgi:biopolymer transport protein ExbB
MGLNRAKLWTACCLLALGPGLLRAADSLDDAVRQASLDYAKRIEAATKELNDTRESIAAERAPMMEQATKLQDRIIELESEVARLENTRTGFAQDRRRLRLEFDGVAKNLSYVNTLAQDNLKLTETSFLPGESEAYSDRIGGLRQVLEDPARTMDAGPALDLSDLLLDRLHRLMGGYAQPGNSLVGDDNRVVKGTFAFVGPEVFFKAEQGDIAGTVRAGDETLYPVTYPLPQWKAAGASPFFQGQPGTIFADPSGGKALRLRETKGTVMQHIDRGGVVAYILIGLGGVSILIAVLKVIDLRNLTVDDPRKIGALLAAVARGSRTDAQALVGGMGKTCSELFSVGIRHMDGSKDLLEEQLFAVNQRQRLFFERRLPLLAVIVTASPLLGLLGTVMGMVKTFALITVFGTGNAAKLSSGISQVLITTELGLMVAIPTLIVHSFLSHRTQDKLSLLERYSTEFVIAAEQGRSARGAAKPVAS